MAKNIYGFIVDEALHNWSDSAVLASQVDQGAGYATENILEYFNKVNVLKDGRSTRSTQYLGNNKTMAGNLAILIDNKPPNSAGSITTADGSVDIAADVLSYSGSPETFELSDEELQRIFNIVEDCLYSRSVSSEDFTTTYLNVRFSSSSSTTYAGYQTGTLKLSSQSVDDEEFMSGMKAWTSDGGEISADNLTIPYWIEFGFKPDGDSAEVIYFKLWVSRDHFLANYPLTTICEVVKPLSALALVDPYGSINNTSYNAVIDSAKFINDCYKSNLQNYEASGVTVFSTRYFPDSLTNLSMPFGVIYKGRAPGDELCRKAIKNSLSTEAGDTVDTVTWHTAFPDLFINNNFFLVPNWGSCIVNTDNVSLEKGISVLQTYLSNLYQIFPRYSTNYIDAKLEIVLSDATDILIGSIPKSTNDGKTMAATFKYYIPVDGTDSSYTVQDENTRTFNNALCRAIEYARKGSIDAGETAITYTTVDMSDIVEDTTDTSKQDAQNRKWLLFTVDYVNYYVLDKSEWLTLV